MKKLILKSKFFLLAFSFLTFVSCSSDDNNSSSLESPSVNYAAINLDAIFFQTGNSDIPTINWNGNQGSVSLGTPTIGLSINTTTGVLNWTKDLPLGTHNVQVVATNSAGQTTVNMTLDNPFQGVFTGTFNGSAFFEIEFNSNGSLIVRSSNETNPNIATGSWTKSDSTIESDYTFDSSSLEYSVSGTLTIGVSAIYSGDWFDDHGTVSGNEGGPFEVILD